MAEQKVVTENSMRDIFVAKLTLNVGAGTDQRKLEKGLMLLQHITGIPAVKTTTQKRIPGWGLRPGLPIGCKITLRGKVVEDLLKRLLVAKDNKLTPRAFDDNGNVAFGLHEYIEIPEVKYSPDIGMMGFQICATLERPGYRIKKRKIAKHKVPKSHKIMKEDAMDFMKKKFGVKIE